MARGGLKVSEAKAAAARVAEWLDGPFAAVAPADDIALVLAHYAKLTKPKCSAKGRYIKGRGYEYEIRDDLKASGFQVRRVVQSGGGDEKDDIVFVTGWDEEFRLEAKRVAKLPAYLTSDHDTCAAVLFREDRGETYALMTFARFKELCQ